MIDPAIRAKYTVTIGIECHVQLKTKTKLFAGVGNDAREAAPNTLVSHICFGLPGALPVLNAAAIRLAARAAFALGTVPQKYSAFDRKHYFYPDLPKGYQITQLDHPIIANGSIEVLVDGEPRTIGITRAHMEEDAGKSTHPAGADYSLVDLNRAGTPLIEIVSEPDMHSPAEARAYARELYLRMKFAGVSEADLYYGNMRFDVNTSVSTDPAALGTRTETKNLNSFRAVERAAEFEINRQIELLEKGGTVVQETRGWDDDKQKTLSQRSKEEAQDYRYFPDPDLPPVVLDDDYIESVRAELPVLPDEWRRQLAGLGVPPASVETLLEAHVDDGQGCLDNIGTSMADTELARFLANWYVNIKLPLLRESGAELAPDDQLTLETGIHKLLQAKKLSSTNAKAMYAELLAQPRLPEDLAAHAAAAGYLQESDEGAVDAIVRQTLADNPKAVEDVRAGEAKAIGFLTGQVMKASKGKANPQLAQQLIRRALEEGETS